jgi:hypothetical protein
VSSILRGICIRRSTDNSIYDRHYISMHPRLVLKPYTDSSGIWGTDNEQEHFRNTESSNVDDRTQHEIYLHPFLRSVQAGVASVMCSYNRERQKRSSRTWN